MPFALYAVCRMSRVESGPSTSILRTWCRQRVSIALQPGRLDIPCMRLEESMALFALGSLLHRRLLYSSLWSYILLLLLISSSAIVDSIQALYCLEMGLRHIS